jgi:hypothetical protein
MYHLHDVVGTRAIVGPEPCLLLRTILPIERSLGKMCEMSGLRAGRDVQNMVTLISAEDQIATPTPSRVVSGEMEISYRLFRRMILVMQTLRELSVLDIL